ncbi:MAG: glycosyltransferase family 2 protein [Nitrosomonadales bacterium]|nr:glycosyltransferase family 2 protein [Nitrosomonadales bacterium]
MALYDLRTNISCIIPCFNDARNLPQAVASCLRQGNDMEVIIVDDCSTDNSFPVAQELASASAGRVRVLRNAQNSGPAFSRNHGVLHARGALLCFLDSDDEYLPGFAGRCATLLEQQPGLAAVKTLMEVVNPDGSRPLSADDPRLLAASSSYPCNMMLRKEVFLALGGFPTDTRFRGPLGGEDDAFFRTLGELFRCLRIPHALVRHNNRPGSHLETFLARSRTEGGRLIFTHRDPALKEDEVIAATQDYSSRARTDLSSLLRCSRHLLPPSSGPEKHDASRSGGGSPRISFITTCKGRLHHLQQTLPLLAALENVEVIVVDYACPQGTADWVNQHYPHVRVIRINDDPGFHLGRARNAGAKAATAPWLCFIDADIIIKDGLLAWAMQNLRPEAFFRPQPNDTGLYGSFFCPQAAFRKIAGYDEAIHGWGGEDEDIYHRLRFAGYRDEGYPSALIAAIRHGDEERTTFYAVKDKFSSLFAYRWYSIMKADLMAASNAPLPQQECLALMQLARDAAARVEQTGVAEHTDLFLNLGERMDTMRYTGWEIQRKLVYRYSRRGAAIPS